VADVRAEQEIFDELFRLCGSQGYVHALSILCFRDNFVKYNDEIKSEDLEPMFSKSRLIRTEISTLAGLLSRQEIDFAHPGQEALQNYANKTEELLHELHMSIAGPMFDPSAGNDSGLQPQERQRFLGSALREPIFYGGESAYGFQYRDLARKKYSGDDDWLLTNKGFTIDDACTVVGAVVSLQNNKLKATHRSLRSTPINLWTMLPGLSFTVPEVAAFAKLSIDSVERVLNAFTLPCRESNAGFTSLHAYNASNGMPLLCVEAGKYILWHQYSLFEALYESPFFWMIADKKYEQIAMAHRGHFAEEFVDDRLSKVFGGANVHRNVNVWKSKTEQIGEIDVLVIFGNRAIVLQAKSKRLTLEARKGNDFQIKDDFKKAIQNSFDQSNVCARALLEPKTSLRDRWGKTLEFPLSLKLIYPICVVLDHYPALSFQCRQFLEVDKDIRIAPPLVTDVFAVDVITEMLGSPLRLLSYLDLRSRFGDKLLSSHELVMLAFHLKRNLWLNTDLDLVALEDDISTDLDIAMTARRDGVPGARTPDGILTRITNTNVGRIIADIEKLPDVGPIELGLQLLELAEPSINVLNRGIRQIILETKRDGKKHDLTLGLGTSSAGLTVHCNTESLPSAQNLLELHCHVRKYSQKADRWFGLAIRPDGSLRFGINLDFPWGYDAEDEELVSGWPKSTMRPLTAIGTKSARKIARNASCPCGSGKKYKRCCGQGAI
jgi:hypothetical protein